MRERNLVGGDIRVADMVIELWLGGMSMEEIVEEYPGFATVHQVACVIGAAYTTTRTMRAKVKAKVGH